eukprot:m.256017 g.256017  ORF g.256017 m.256017 type:complete len:103 (-) comp15512_c0_seq11:803-1111(-)
MSLSMLLPMHVSDHANSRRENSYTGSSAFAGFTQIIQRVNFPFYSTFFCLVELFKQPPIVQTAHTSFNQPPTIPTAHTIFNSSHNNKSTFHYSNNCPNIQTT